MDLVKIGKFIAQKRKDKGLTQASLAEKLNVSDKAISKWERGICLMDMTLLEPLSIELGVSVNEVLAGEDINNEDKKVLNESTISGIKSYQKKMKKKTIILLTILYFLIVIPCFTYIGIVVLDINCGSIDNFKVANNFYDALRTKDLDSLKKLVTSPYDPNQLLVIVPSAKMEAVSPDEFIENIKTFYDNGGKFVSFETNHKSFFSSAMASELCAEQNGKKGCIGLDLEAVKAHASFTAFALWDSSDKDNLTQDLMHLFNAYKEKEN